MGLARAGSVDDVVAYKYGPYLFGVKKNGRIIGLSGESFDDEHDLIKNYDDTRAYSKPRLGDFEKNPLLIRCYADGSELQLRPKKEEP